jgi:hypothetical protein
MIRVDSELFNSSETENQGHARAVGRMDSKTPLANQGITRDFLKAFLIAFNNLLSSSSAL